MSVSYQAVGWNRQKRIYDLVLAGGIVLYLGVFVGLGATLHPDATAETLLIRGLGTLALLLLHVVLSIGPLCRLDPRFLPLLYNRRHLGVTMFVIAFAHGAFSLLQFHGFGDLNPLVNVLVGNDRYSSLSQFPFQPLGLGALGILFLMAATSHDFWLANLTAPVWKALHMLVYVAYALVLMHVVLGVLQYETHPILTVTLALGFLWVVGLHLVAARREAGADAEAKGPAEDGFVDVGNVADIPENRARTLFLAGERVAIFRYDGKVSALSSVCKHQNGPLGEGKIVDGCVVCPWHGYQYRPHDGASPPPFTETVPTFRVRVQDGRVWVDPRPLPPGTEVPPASIDGTGATAQEAHHG
ncbi:MAG: Rieske 2Fe-2S domain-containing protein [Acidobacteriota bacterium]